VKSDKKPELSPSLKNLKRGGQPGRKKGVPNKATQDIKAMARAWTLEDSEWVDSARARMKSGNANHLETYLLQMGYGKPKEDVPPGLPASTTINILALLGSLPVEKLREINERLLNGDTPED
jgi:hypothetical protein